MTCFELSRTGFQPAENPNSEKPKLSLGGYRKPVAEVVIPEQHLREESQILVDKVRNDNVANILEDLPPKNECAAKPPTEPARTPLPFVIYPGDPTWTDPKGRAAALTAWRGKIIHEVGRKFSTKSERDLAEDFARSHRLSIANTFERRIVRADVVAELSETFPGPNRTG